MFKRIIKKSIICCYALVVIGSVGLVEAKQVRDEVGSIEQLVEECNYEKAVSAIGQVLRNSEILLEKEDKEIAQLIGSIPRTEYITKLDVSEIKEWPEHSRVFVADQYWLTDRLKPARNLYESLVVQIPLNNHYRVQLAKIYGEQGNYKKEFDTYLEALYVSSDDFFVIDKLLYLIRHYKLHKSYLAIIEEQKKRFSCTVNNRYRMAWMCHQLELYDEALVNLRAVFGNGNIADEIQRAAIDLLKHNPQKKDAKMILKKLSDIDLGKTSSAQLGDYLREQGNYYESILLYQKALRKGHINVWVYISLATCYERLGKFKPAWANLKKAIALKSGDPNFYYWIYNYVKRHKDYIDQAATLIESLNDENANTATIMFVGLIQMLDGKELVSERSLNSALDLAMGRMQNDVVLKIALFYKECHKIERAIAIIERLVEHAPDFMPAILELARLYNDRGDFDKTAYIMQNKSVVEKNPGQAYLILGDMYRKMNEKYLAEQNFALAIRQEMDSIDQWNLLNSLYPGEGYRVSSFLRLSLWEEFWEEPDYGSPLLKNHANSIGLNTTWFWKDLPHLKIGYQLFSYRNNIDENYSYDKNIFEISSNDLVDAGVLPFVHIKLGAGFKSIYVKGLVDSVNRDENQLESFANLSLESKVLGNLSCSGSYLDINAVHHSVKVYTTNLYLSYYKNVALWDFSIYGQYYYFHQMMLPWENIESKNGYSGNVWKRIYGPISASAGGSYKDGVINSNRYNDKKYYLSLSYAQNIIPYLFLELSPSYSFEVVNQDDESVNLFGRLNYLLKMNNKTSIHNENITVQNDINIGVEYRRKYYWRIKQSVQTFRGYLRFFM